MHAFDRHDGRTDRRTDGRTDGQTEFPSLYRDCIPCSAVKINQIFKKFACGVSTSSVSWISRLKPNLTVYDKLLCKNKKSIKFKCLMISYL